MAFEDEFDDFVNKASNLTPWISFGTSRAATTSWVEGDNPETESATTTKVNVLEDLPGLANIAAGDGPAPLQKWF